MMLGVSRQSVTKWESERSYPEMDKLLKMCQIFDCTLDDLVQGDLTDRLSDPAVSSAPKAPPADVFGYDEFMRRFAMKISLGVFIVIFGVAVSLIFFIAGDSEEAGWFILPENIAAAIGTMCVLGAVAVSLALFIPAGMEHSHFVRSHPYIEDFYTEEQKAKTRTMFTRQLIGGIVIIFIGICFAMLFDGAPSTPSGSIAFPSLHVEMTGTVCLLVCVSVGASIIVHGAIMLSRTNLANYNLAAAEVMEANEIAQAPIPPEQKEEVLKAQSANKQIGAICGMIMLVATIAGLVQLFIPAYQSPMFWLAWPIGGILCGIVSLFVKAFSRND